MLARTALVGCSFARGGPLQGERRPIAAAAASSDGVMRVALLLAYVSLGLPSPARSSAGEEAPAFSLPTPGELQDSCPAEYKTCMAEKECRNYVKAPVADDPPHLFSMLSRCFNQAAYLRSVGGTEPKVLAEDRRGVLRRAAEDVKCTLCTYVVADLYSIMLRRKAVTQLHRNKFRPPSSDEDTLLMIIGDMCSDPDGITRCVAGKNSSLCVCALIAVHQVVGYIRAGTMRFRACHAEEDLPRGPRPLSQPFARPAK
jgi:hypothetical protein